MNKTSLFPTGKPEVYVTPDSEVELACAITAGAPQPTITWSFQLCTFSTTSCEVSPGAWNDIINMYVTHSLASMILLLPVLALALLPVLVLLVACLSPRQKLT